MQKVKINNGKFQSNAQINVQNCVKLIVQNIGNEDVVVRHTNVDFVLLKAVNNTPIGNFILESQYCFDEVINLNFKFGNSEVIVQEHKLI